MFKNYQNWGKMECKLLGVEVEVQGNIPEQGVLLLSNHRSYIDYPVIIKYHPSCFVAKAEAGKWPFFRWGVKISKTILVDRKDPDSRKKTLNTIRERLEEGLSVNNFPEGTTYKGPILGELRKGSFFMAAQGGFPVVPVAIEFSDRNDAWIGKDSFVPHFIQTFRKKKIYAKLRFGEVIKNDNPEQLLGQVQTWMENALKEMNEEFGLPTA